MDKALKPQLDNSAEIKSILKEVPCNFRLPDQRIVNTLLVYLPCHEDGKISLKEFFEFVRKGILQNFVFSCKEIEKKLGMQSTTAMEDLFDKALRKISKHTAQGELGELLLFTLLDVYLKAPKLLSKVSMKTVPTMPVFGADAVHGQMVDGEFRVYLGESKLYQSFKSAASAAASSMVSAKSKFDVEFDLLDSHMDFPNLDSEFEKTILDVLNPYTTIDSAKKIHSPCFIGFTQPDVIFENDVDYVEAYKKVACQYVGDFFNKVEGKGLEAEEVTLLMLPFTCVSELVDEFISYVGIYK
ncbi:Hachiman antiphage defense system protein HamA [Thaumasiovibrio sp. DFM-14]|uniref:Hachiman antiphage defense system protein HamA n=1 Tax=Thaumasiovibrio sp. DFM-14 TaxID=3384792 RepID=UPI0039A38DF2